ncbi:hydrolase [Clostridium zeae]|uniref:Hydrolase n=1 Tax=Clostridium zeae TaxID=2759022 RepID=A0ABQ1EDS6_9CLOT|nr:YiiX/YebB-like N1pC/P60 family cysteine hydrolase [Clostridium zeae]GFZ32937.1 hydrolase [Clostridium zeae]
MKKRKLFYTVFISSILTLVFSVQAFATTTTSNHTALTQQTIDNTLEKAKSTTSSSETLKKLNEALANKKVVNDPKVSATKSLTSQTSSLTAISGGTYPTRKGVILVTDDKYSGIIPLGHGAIVYSASEVVEALNTGVVIGKNNWNTTRNSCAAGTVTSTTVDQDAAAAEWCKSKVGTPYNYDYYNMSTRSKFYCSQLVWASFKDNYGIDLNTDSYDISTFGYTIASAIHPTELLTNDKVVVTYRNNWDVN